MTNQQPLKIDCDKKTQDNLNNEDPISFVLTLLEKRTRNLEKRKMKCQELQQSLNQGIELNEDQKITVLSLKEINSNLEAIKEICTQVSSIQKTQNTKKPVETLDSSFSKADIIRQSMEIINTLKKLSNNLPQVQALTTNNSKHLTYIDAQNLVAFLKMIKISDETVGNARIRKISQLIANFLNKENKTVSSELSVTFLELNTLYHKIGPTLHAVKCNTEENPETKKLDTPCTVQKEGSHTEEEKPSPWVVVDRPNITTHTKLASKGRQPKAPRPPFPQNKTSETTHIVVKDVTHSNRNRGSKEHHNSDRHMRKFPNNKSNISNAAAVTGQSL